MRSGPGRPAGHAKRPCHAFCGLLLGAARRDEGEFYSGADLLVRHRDGAIAGNVALPCGFACRMVVVAKREKGEKMEMGEEREEGDARRRKTHKPHSDEEKAS